MRLAFMPVCQGAVEVTCAQTHTLIQILDMCEFVMPVGNAAPPVQVAHLAVILFGAPDETAHGRVSVTLRISEDSASRFLADWHASSEIGSVEQVTFRAGARVSRFFFMMNPSDGNGVAGADGVARAETFGVE